MAPFEMHFTTLKRSVSMETADAAAMLDPGSGGIGSRALQDLLRGVRRAITGGIFLHPVGHAAVETSESVTHAALCL